MNVLAPSFAACVWNTVRRRNLRCFSSVRKFMVTVTGLSSDVGSRRNSFPSSVVVSPGIVVLSPTSTSAGSCSDGSLSHRMTAAISIVDLSSAPNFSVSFSSSTSRLHVPTAGAYRGASFGAGCGQHFVVFGRV